MLQPSWIFQSALTSNIARCVVKLTPYVWPDGLQEVVTQFATQTAHLFDKGTGMRAMTSEELESMLDQHLFAQPQVQAWNERKNGSKAPFQFVSNFDSRDHDPDDDFIDLDALRINILMAIEREQERSEGQQQQFEAETAAYEGLARTYLNEVLDWAHERKVAEVDARPDVNIYKQVLTDTWNQVIRHLEAVIVRIGQEDEDDFGLDVREYSELQEVLARLSEPLPAGRNVVDITEEQALSVMGPLLLRELSTQYRQAQKPTPDAELTLLLVSAQRVLDTVPLPAEEALVLLVRLQEYQATH